MFCSYKEIYFLYRSEEGETMMNIHIPDSLVYKSIGFLFGFLACMLTLSFLMMLNVESEGILISLTGIAVVIVAFAMAIQYKKNHNDYDIIQSLNTIAESSSEG